MRKLCALDDAGERTLEVAVRRLGLSARTTAGPDRGGQVLAKHLAEAVQYRSLDRNYWS